MRKKVLQYVALEGNEDGGLDTEQTIESDEPEEGEDKPIEFPDIGNLEVDQVHRQLEEEQEERQERTTEVLDVTERLSSAVEAMRIALQHDGRLLPSFAANVSIGLESARARLGFPVAKPKFSMENYCGFTRSQSMEALNEIIETIKAAWRAVIAAIRAGIVWAKKAFINFFVGVELDIKATKSLTEAILSQRKNPRFKELSENSVNDNEHYVTLAGRKHLLIYEGKQPGQYQIPTYVKGVANGTSTPMYPEAFAHLLELVSTHTKFTERISPELVQQFETICKEIAEDKPVDNKALSFSPMNLLATTFMVTAKTDKLPSAANCGFVTNPFYLSSFEVVTRLNVLPPITLQDSLTGVADWAIAVIQTVESSDDGWMRNMSSDEIKAASNVVVAIEHELMAYEKTLDKMKGVKEKFIKLAEEAAKWVMAAPKDFMEKASPNGWRGELITLIIRAINNMLAQTDIALSQYARKAQPVCKAWNAYLKEIYLKENQMLKSS